MSVQLTVGILRASRAHVSRLASQLLQQETPVSSEHISRHSQGTGTVAADERRWLADSDELRRQIGHAACWTGISTALSSIISVIHYSSSSSKTGHQMRQVLSSCIIQPTGESTSSIIQVRLLQSLSDSVDQSFQVSS